MLDRLLAEEAMTAATAGGMQRLLRPESLRQRWQSWARTARGPRRRGQAQPASPAQLAAMGIAVKVVERG